MRVNLLAVAAIMLLMGMTRMFLNHDPWLGGAGIVLSIVLVVLHFIRVRRFKRYDQARNFD
jgi:hypothetical protein